MQVSGLCLAFGLDQFDDPEFFEISQQAQQRIVISECWLRVVGLFVCGHVALSCMGEGGKRRRTILRRL